MNRQVLLCGLLGGLLIALLKAVEPFPAGLIFTIVCAGILRRGRRMTDEADEQVSEAVAARQRAR